MISLKHDLTITSPNNKKLWHDYLDFRWRYLRQPWNEPKGSEQDQCEKNSIHKIALLDNKLIGVGRIHKQSTNIAQIRYMAVAPDYFRQGIGSTILETLEISVKDLVASHELDDNASDITQIILHSRETAIGFYQQHGYSIIKKSHTLYGEIEHYLMRKSMPLAP